MSKIAKLGTDFCNLPDILDVYTEELRDANDKLKITGKKLETSNSENSAWLHYYDERKVELHALVKFFNLELDKVKGTLFKSYKENYSRSLTERDISKYIMQEPAVLDISALLIEVEEVYEQFASVVNAFTSRNYALTNITKLRVASMEFVEI